MVNGLEALPILMRVCTRISTGVKKRETVLEETKADMYDLKILSC